MLTPRQVTGIQALEGQVTIKTPLNMRAFWDVPVRQHHKKLGQMESYHRRIQKKWIKRFGMVQEPALVILRPVVPGGVTAIMCHEDTKPHVEAVLYVEAVLREQP